VKHDSRQLSLGLAPPSRQELLDRFRREWEWEREEEAVAKPFSLDPSPDLIVLCRQCGRQIVAQHGVPGRVESEYRDGAGRCFECAHTVHGG